jgi:cobalt-zinc-cadmium efflux system membrane fusion protein
MFSMMMSRSTSGRINALRVTLCLLLITLLGACHAPDHAAADADHGHAHGPAAHDDHGGADEHHPEGPNGGRLLSEGDFALEMGIDEAGRPPRWQLRAYWQGQLIDPATAQVTVRTIRIDGETHEFPLMAEGETLVGTGVVIEPHSFDVEINAQYQGRRYHWQYDSYEGRTAISNSMASTMGIAVAPVGAATIEQTLDVFGRVDFAPGALVTLRAQFPGRVTQVMKNEGERVQRNEVLAVIEANESLRSYEVRATMDGMIIQRGTNVGDVVDDAALFVIGDPTQLRVSFHVYPGDFSRIRPGHEVQITSVDGELHEHTNIVAYLPTTEAATQTIIAYANLPNDNELWIPGMIVSGSVVVAENQVPLAVKTEAIQRFRDFSVVFAKVGEEYEVRMLDLGRQNNLWTEVLGGIKPGQEYVTENSFLIKADIEKDGASHDH